MPELFRLLFGLIALALVATPAGAAQGGHKIETYDELGIRMPKPNAFLRIPIPPFRDDLRLKYVTKPKSGRDTPTWTPAQVVVVELDAKYKSDATRALDLWLEDHGLGFSRNGGAAEITTRRGYKALAYGLNLRVRRLTYRGFAKILLRDGSALALIGMFVSPDDTGAWEYSFDELRSFAPKPPNL